MSDDRHDDEMLGRALSRAIETQAVRETPYERSGLAVRPLRRGFPLWQTLGVAATFVLAIAFGAWFSRPGETPPAGASPTATALPSPTPTSEPAVASVAPSEKVWIYLTRDALPPLGMFVDGFMGPSDTAEHRIMARIGVARNARSPYGSGVSDPLSLMGTADATGHGSFTVGARVQGDTATVDLSSSSGWGVTSPVQSRLLVQQLVYLITEEPGIHYVRLTQDNGKTATIGGIVVDQPLSRDDVAGYAARAPIGMTTIGGKDKVGSAIGATLVSRDIQDGTLARLTFEGRDRAANDATADLPSITVSFERNNGTVPHNTVDGPAPTYLLTVGFKWNSSFSSGGVGHVERIDRSPLRLITGDFNTSYQLGLDDARPWRAYMPDAQHLVVEIGGDPRLISDRIALQRPIFDEIVPRTFAIAGLARTFEANVVWRVKDATQRVVASGHTTASIGTSVLWGTFSTQVSLPSTAGGRLSVEIYEVSPKDGSEQGLVAVPINP